MEATRYVDAWKRGVLSWMTRGLCRSLPWMATIAAMANNAYYVSPAGLHRHPFQSWEDAATNIQTAVDVASDGDTVWVGDGIYAHGQTNVYGWNRVAVRRPIIVRSANGPDAAVIRGQGPCGPDAVRGVYVGDGAQLIGFTVRDGATATNYPLYHGGGIYAESGGTVSNCVIRQNTSYFYGGGISGGVVGRCVLFRNEARFYGGGAYDTRVYGSSVISNRAGSAGGGISGKHSAAAENCLIAFNDGGGEGGGTALGVFPKNCTIVGNRADVGGGCTTRAENSIVYYNKARVTGHNFADHWERYWRDRPQYCATEPVAGTNGVIAIPRLVSLENPHLLPDSPCIDAGNDAFATGQTVDFLDGARQTGAHVDIGCVEAGSHMATGNLSGEILLDASRWAVGFPCTPRARIQGVPLNYTWSFGDGVSTSGVFNPAHRYRTPGSYDVTLSISNLDAAISVTAAVEAVDMSWYVSPTGSHQFPFTNWIAAARDIQSAVDACDVVGAVVWVDRGVYAQGSRLYDGVSNRLVVDKPVTVRAIHGPGETFIVGCGPGETHSNRCVFLATDATLAGFTVTNGYATIGAGVLADADAVVSNCIIVGNHATFRGGGVYGGTCVDSVVADNRADNSSGGMHGGRAIRCRIENNTAVAGGGGGWYIKCWNSVIRGNRLTGRGYGGGLNAGKAYYCTIVSNYASWHGGGLYEGAVHYCIVASNKADQGSHDARNTDLWDSCVRVRSGTKDYGGNITSDPRFADYATGDLTLRANSPCIDLKIDRHAWWYDTVDMLGRGRPMDGKADGLARLDLGAFEFLNPVADSDGDGMPDSWEDTHGLDLIRNDRDEDSDGDGHTHGQEYTTDTDPRDPLDYFRADADLDSSAGTALTLHWRGAVGRSYDIRAATAMTNNWFSILPGRLPGVGGSMSHTVIVENVRGFYRMEVHLP